MSSKSIQITANDIESARQQANAKISKNERILSEKVISDGTPKEIIKTGQSSEVAFNNAFKHIPKDAKIISKNIIAEQSFKSELILGYTEDEAKKKVSSIAEGFKIDKLILKEHGNKGFLGFGRKPNCYEIFLSKGVTVSIKYSTKAVVYFKVGNKDEKGKCGKRVEILMTDSSKRIKPVNYGGFGEPYCSNNCYEQAGHKMTKARLSGAIGNCHYCKSRWKTGPILVRQNELVFICESCADRVQPEIKALGKCYYCDILIQENSITNSKEIFSSAELEQKIIEHVPLVHGEEKIQIAPDKDAALEKALRQIEETRPEGPRRNFDAVVARVRDEFIPGVRGVKTMSATTSEADIKVLTDCLFWMICKLVKEMSGVPAGPRLKAAEDAAISAVSTWFAEHYAHYAGADIVDYFSNPTKAERAIGVLADIVIRSFTISLNKKNRDTSQ